MSPDSARAIEDFWSWWGRARPGVEAAPVADGLGRYEPDLTAAVHRMHPGLQWEIGGRNGVRQLVVTAAGNPDARSAAARWLLAAPPERSGWVFHAARQPDPVALSSNLVLGPGVPKLRLADMSVAVLEDDESWRIQVVVYHEVFSVVAAAQRLDIAYLALGWALGEEEVQRWVGEVTAVARRPDGAIDLAGLPAAFEDFAKRHPRSFALVRASIRGLPLTAVVQAPMSPVDFPLFDQHIAVVVPYATMNSGRLQVGASAERIRDFDDALNALVGDDGVLAVAVSHDGERVFHYYADPSSGVAERVTAWDHCWPEGRVEVRTGHDPAWNAVRPFQP